MLRIRQVKLNINENNLKSKIAKKLNTKESNIINYKIHKKSLDARRENISYIYEVDVNVKNEEFYLCKNNDIIKTPDETYRFNITGNNNLKEKPIIIGSGPAGLFAAYILAENGYKPIIIEQGEKIEDRVKSVNKFWETGKLNPLSNVTFGEGGAGTFSDGKLNTTIKDKEGRKQKVLEIFVQNGAPEEILYENKPHIGTDLLRKVIINMRSYIIKMGGTFKYNAKLTNLIIKNNKLEKIILNNNEEINCETLILAIGHSSRDTFKILMQNNINIKAKPFAIGIRIQHPQDMIDQNQYGPVKGLPKASYKLTFKSSNNRGVYSFCMCPGGYVVNSSSENNHLCINGMSNHDRSSGNANSAIIVTVSPDDFGINPLDGVKYQKEIEAIAFQKGNGKIPVQLFKDFLNNKISTSFKEVKPLFKGDYTFANINEILPKYICDAIKEGITNFDKKIKGFKRDDAIIAGVETRTSSPVQIIRNENFESNIKGIFPCGEGAGYAGGITSAAIDGLKASEAIAKIYKPC